MSALAQPLGEGAHITALPLLHAYFERAARLWPDIPAIDIPPDSGRLGRQLVSYAELQKLVQLIAAALQRRVTGESVVAICLPRHSPLLYAAQLAVLRTGAAHACLDPSFPDEQAREILSDARPVAVLTDTLGCRRLTPLTPSGAALIDLTTLAAPSESRSAHDTPPSWLSPSTLAYVIYTSGTTGRPKGVMIEHAAIANLVGSDLTEFRLGPGDRVAQGSSSAYDSSIEETWLALASGATLVVMDDAAARLGPDLIAWLRRERITVLCPPPTLLRATGCANPARELPDLRLLYVGGEALPPDVADRWAHGRRLENGYGPTECAVTSLRTRIPDGAHVSIGRPVPGVQAWALDENLDEVPDGEPGELCLGGVALARGYRHLPELTAEKFPTHPRLGRIYRTGDRVHRDASGDFHYRGRMDSQVKLRGYRIELEAIEARLAACPGVREAACHVQGEGSRQILVGFVVPVRSDTPPAPETLLAELRRTLPVYMVPTRLGFLPDLPRTVGGKLNRRALPSLEGGAPESARAAVPPRSDTERLLCDIFLRALDRRDPVSIHDDFFADLGGDSLSAAVATSLCRDRPETATLAVRDLYEAPTVAGLARRISAAPAVPVRADTPPRRSRRSPRATLLQVAWLLKDLILSSTLAGVAAVHLAPALLDTLGLAPAVLLAPLLLPIAFVLQTTLGLALAVLAKRTLIGRYRPLRAPVWSEFYLRNWIVLQTLRLIPWSLLEGTEFQCIALRALGARIGRRVHLHRGVDLRQGGWDLLEIGDDVTVSQDATLRLVELEDGEIVVGPVTLGSGCTLDIHAGVGGHTEVGSGAYLTAWSSLERGEKIPAGEKWGGIPAAPAGMAAPPPRLTVATRELSPFTAGLWLAFARTGLWLLLALPAEILALVLADALGLDTALALGWLAAPTLDARLLLACAFVATLATPLTLATAALACRGMGRVRPGIISRWSAAYVRVWLKSGLVDFGGQWLYGTLFWPHWLRVAGMKIGRGCEISGLIDTVPELVEIGDRTFCADGIYLGGPRLHCGTVTLAPVRLGANTFLGNGVIISVGQSLPDDILLGVCTAADEAKIHAGTAWFGHPPFRLPQRQVVPCDPRLTHAPSIARYLSRLFWETLRFALPAAPAVALPLWFFLLAAGGSSSSLLLLVTAPLATLSVILSLGILALAIKWALIGRVSPSSHALWSSWASRWDFHCMAWSIYAPPLASVLEGTPLLALLLRAAGARVGRDVILGCGAARDLPDPDMLTLEDGVTMDGAFQAHTFEDRVLKLDRIVIRREASVGRGALLLYGADIGARARVAPHSVVMKHERLLPDLSYAGFPTKAISPAEAAA